MVSMLYLGMLFYFTYSYTYNPLYSFILFITYLYFIYLIIKYKFNTNIPIIAISILYLSLLFIRYILYDASFFKLQNYLFLIVVAIFHLLALLVVQRKHFFLTLGLYLILNFVFNYYVFFFVNCKMNFSTYFGEYDHSITKELNIYDVNKKKIIFKPDTVYVFDIWNKGCGVCFLKFPLFENLKEKYASDNGIEFIALNIHLDGDNLFDLKNQFEQYTSNVKVLFMNNANLNQIQTNLFPTVIVVKNNKIIYKGDVETLNALNWYYLKQRK